MASAVAVVSRRPIRLERGQAVLEPPYPMPELAPEMASLAGWRWDGFDRRWTGSVNGFVAQVLVEVAVTHGLDIDDEIIDLAEASEAASRAPQVDPAQVESLEIEGFVAELWPHQKEAALLIAMGAKPLLADPMGLGKTRSLIAGVRLFGAERLIVLCPAVVKLVWRDEVAKSVPTWRTALLEGTRADVSADAFSADVVIANYDISKAWLDAIVEGYRPDAVVFDESHYLRTPGRVDGQGRWKGTQRTAAARLLAKDVRERGGLVQLASGTPIVKGRPAELIPQLDIAGVLEHFGGRMTFARRYCGYKRDRFGEHLEGCERPEELHRRLVETCMLRRPKDMLEAKLPRAIVHLESDPAALAEYRRAEADIVSYMAERAREIAEELGEDGDKAARRARFRAAVAKKLVEVNMLRQLVTDAKLKATTDWVRNFIQSSTPDDSGVLDLPDERPSGKLVCFAHFQKTAETLATELADLDPLLLTGKVNETERARAIATFQEDPSRRLIVVSIDAAGVGVTLTASNNVAFVELPWTIGALLQAEDRCHRIGQRWPVTPWVLLSEGKLLDSIMWEVLGRREADTVAVLDGMVKEGNAEEGGSDDVASEVMELLIRERGQASD